MPTWYGFLKTAQYLNAQPWVLAGIPGPPHWLWSIWGEIARRVDITVQNAAYERAMKSRG